MAAVSSARSAPSVVTSASPAAKLTLAFWTCGFFSRTRCTRAAQEAQVIPPTASRTRSTSVLRDLVPLVFDGVDDRHDRLGRIKHHLHQLLVDVHLHLRNALQVLDRS